MPEKNVDRRRFIKQSAIASAGAALSLSLEEKALLAKEQEKTNAANKRTHHPADFQWANWVI